MPVMRKQVLNDSETEIHSDSEENNTLKDLLLKEKELNQLIDDYDNYNKYLKNDIREKDRLLNVTMVMLIISGFGHLIVSVYLICYM